MGIKWTDGDLQCLIKQENSTSFYYGEVRFIGNGNIYCATLINILDYSGKEINDILTSYYSGGLKEVKSIYKENANQIIAECIFEQTSLLEMDYVSDVFLSENQAAKSLSEYAKTILKEK